MKLNWFSPLPPAKTDIANFTARLLPYLSEDSEVILWSKEGVDMSLLHGNEACLFRNDVSDFRELNKSDLTIYNLGNNQQFHSSIWATSLRHPGVVILHDYCLQHFVAGYFRGQNNREGYIHEMEANYGDQGRYWAEACWDGWCSVDYLAEKYPLTLSGLKGSLAAVVHSQQCFDLVRNDTNLPVVMIPLPYPAAERSFTRDYSTPPYTIVMFGYMGTNRRVEQFLQAFAKLTERTLFRVAIYGQLWEGNPVQEMVSDLGIDDLVQIHGFVPDTVLDAALCKAHLAINLRYPTMGEASGSQLRIWEHALPSLVTKVGWYANLPAETVAFVRPENEEADIHALLEAFLANPYRFAEMGAKGRQCLEQQHSPTGYVKKLMNFCSHLPEFRRLATMEQLTKRIGSEIGPWLRSGKSREILTGISESIASLLTAGKKD